MGKTFMDEYSLLHAAVGVVAYFWGISLENWMILHSVFEILENTDVGMKFINTYVKMCPGGKTRKDTCLNSVSDTIFAMVGWIIAYYVVANYNK
jgi:hypothetical protein